MLISKTWHVQLTGWVFLILLTWMWTECTTLWFGRVLFLALIAVLTWGRWVLFPAVVWAGCGGVKAELHPPNPNPYPNPSPSPNPSRSPNPNLTPTQCGARALAIRGGLRAGRGQRSQ